MRCLDYRLRSLLASCALTGALVIPLVAHAAGVSPIDASPEQRKQATDHFVAGKQALESNNWDQAISELRASLQVVDSPNSHLELARALRDSGKLSEAWFEFGRAIETATRLAPKEGRYAKTADAATTERGDLEAKLALVVVTVAHAPADATLKVGGRIVSPEDWSGPLVVTPGAVEIVLTNRGGADVAHLVVAASVGQTTPVSLDTQTASAVDAGPGNEATEPSDDNKPGSDERPTPDTVALHRSGGTNLRPYAYLAGGIGVAGLGAFTIFGLLSNAAYSDLQSSCTRGCPPDKRGEIDSGRTQQTVANVGLGVGLVGLAAGATLFFLSIPSASPTPGAALVVAPGYLGVRGSL
jgi:hypothetical protein